MKFPAMRDYAKGLSPEARRQYFAELHETLEWFRARSSDAPYRIHLRGDRAISEKDYISEVPK